MRFDAATFINGVAWIRVFVYLLLSTFVIGNLATFLRRRRNWPDGYTRKINHLGHMLTATPLLVVLPPEQLIPSVLVAAILVVIIYVAAARSSRPFVAGIIDGSLRRRDAPRERFFFFLPLISGNISLLLASLLFPLEAVRLAAMSMGLGDGLAEPVGIRWGANSRFNVRDPLWGGYNVKSAHGCAAVFVSSLLVCIVLRSVAGIPIALLPSIVFAGMVTVIEALSPRGLDNMNIFLFGSLVGTLLFARG